MNKEQSIIAIKNGYQAAILVGVVTTGLGLFGLWGGFQSGNLWNDISYSLFDAVFIFICSYFIYKKTRYVSILFLIYFIFAKIYTSIAFGRPVGLVTGLIIVYFLFRAVQGTFTYHSIEKHENPSYKTTSSKWLSITGICIMSIFSLLIVIGLLDKLGYLELENEPPDEAIVALKELKEIKNESEWNEHTEKTFIAFFSKLHDINMGELGYGSDPIDPNQSLVLSLMSDFIGDCTTQQMKLIYHSPSKLFEDIMSSNTKGLAEAKNICFDKIKEIEHDK